MSLGFIFLCCTLAIVHGQDNFRLSYIAEQMDQYCNLRIGESTYDVTTPSQLGPRVGKAGPSGPRGRPGAPGVVNYTRVETFIEEVMGQQMSAFFKMEETIATLKKSLERLDGEITKMRKNIRNETKKAVGGFCKVEYNGKCFWAIPAIITASEGRSRCQQVAGQAANIYDAIHYEMMRKCLATLATDGDDYATGMNYDSSTSRVTFRDGTTASYVRWVPGYPSTTNSRPVIMFQSHRKTERKKGRKKNGVLCEI